MCVLRDFISKQRLALSRSSLGSSAWSFQTPEQLRFPLILGNGLQSVRQLTEIADCHPFYHTLATGRFWVCDLRDRHHGDDVRDHSRSSRCSLGNQFLLLPDRTKLLQNGARSLSGLHHGDPSFHFPLCN